MLSARHGAVFYIHYLSLHHSRSGLQSDDSWSWHSKMGSKGAPAEVVVGAEADPGGQTGESWGTGALPQCLLSFRGEWEGW